MEIFALFRDGFIGLVSTDILNSHVKVIVFIVMETAVQTRALDKVVSTRWNASF